MRLSKILPVFAFLLFLSSASPAYAAFTISQGGTATSTAPAYGQTFVGNKSGGWDYVATSTFGGGGSGAVSSVFGRTGAVVAQTGDYNTSQLTELTNLFFTNARALASTLTGYVSGAGTISATDSILSAIQKLNGNIAALVTGVSAVSNSDGTLTISPTTGSVVASLALSHANTWTGQQTFNTTAPKFGTVTGLTQCLHVDTTGLLSGTGTDCGSSGGSVTAVTGTYPIISSGGTAPAISTAFGTTTNNTYSGTNIFNNGVTTNALSIGSLSGTLNVNSGTVYSTGTSTPSLSGEFTYGGALGSFIGGSSGALSLTTNGTALSKLVQISGNTILGNNTGATSNVVAFATSTLGIALSDTTGTLQVARGGTGATTFTGGQLIEGNGTNALFGVATGTIANGAGISVTAGQSIIGTGLTITNTGVTSNVAGTGINVSGATGAVTITNGGVITLGNGTGTTCSGTNPGTCNVNTTQNITTLSNLSVAGFVQSTSGGVLSSAALTSGNITTALGFTPFGGTNPLPITNGGTGTSTPGLQGQNVYVGASGIFTGTSTIFTNTASNVGIGTTTPAAKLTVNPSVNTSDALDVTNTIGSTTARFGTLDTATDTFGVSSSTGQVEFGVDSAGHNWTGGVTPTLTSCGGGTPAVTGDDNSGTITLGTGVTAACTLNFVKTWAQTPTCSATSDAAGVSGEVTAISTTAVTFGVTTGNAGGKVYYGCRYHHT